MTAPTSFEGVHCTMQIARHGPRVVVVTIAGRDVGEFGDAPFQALAEDLHRTAPLDLFIDGRKTQGASIDVSNDWALWLRKHRDRLGRVTMLTGSKFVHITADFVRRFAELGDLMRITTEPAAFDAALADALAEDESSSGSERDTTFP